MRVWTNLCNRKLSYAAGTDSKQVCKDLCNSKFWRVFRLICAISKAPMLLEMIVCEFREICEIEKGLMLLAIILWEFGQICTTGNAFVRPTEGRNLILNFPARIWKEMFRAHLCGDDSSHSQGQSGKRLFLASRGHPVRSVAYQATSSNPLDQTHTLDPTPGQGCIKLKELS